MNAGIAHGGGLAAAAKLFGGTPDDWLDLSTGINPTPAELPDMPKKVWHRLPDADLAMAAREAARRYYRSGDLLPLPVPGTQSLIQLLPSLVRQGSRVAILSPSYGEYAHVLQSAGFKIDRIMEPDDVTPEHALAVVVNPNNPDGRRHDPADLRRLHERMARSGGLFVVDEAFGDTDPHLSLAPLARDMPQLLIFRSFGKFFGLAGLRLGFAIGHEPLLQKLERGLGPWAVSGPALFLAQTLLARDTAVIAAGIETRRNALYAVLAEAGFSASGGTALFALVDDHRAASLHAHLCSRHILVRKFDYAPTWLRFGLPPDASADRRLLTALRDFRG